MSSDQQLSKKHNEFLKLHMKKTNSGIGINKNCHLDAKKLLSSLQKLCDGAISGQSINNQEVPWISLSIIQYNITAILFSFMDFDSIVIQLSTYFMSGSFISRDDESSLMLYQMTYLFTASLIYWDAQFYQRSAIHSHLISVDKVDQVWQIVTPNVSVVNSVQQVSSISPQYIMGILTGSSICLNIFNQILLYNL